MTTEALSNWISLYLEPMFWLYPMATLAISIGAFLLFALPLTLLAWIDPPALQRFKVQSGPFQVERWLAGSLGRLFGNALLVAVLLVVAWPVMRYTTIHTGALPAWWAIGLQLLFFIFLDDFLYYWMHRAMHKGWLLRKVHSVHHRIRQTCAINGNYFHPLEFILTGTLVLVGPLLVGAHIYVLWMWVALRQFEAADGHSGYVFPWNPGHLLPLYEGAGYHDFHHTQYQGNFAGFLPYLDRFFGSYARGYLEWRAQRKGRPVRATT